ncbi:Metal transporter Nramp5 [Vitis vinifera]|uniref:Metal transporter Nramp5 n=1 Tax=Vitis vinifera TaxID=29760 RepID=A0A438EU04_VITVI|nr:Metal transporter Nramp5 [Vitis vinifera]
MGSLQESSDSGRSCCDAHRLDLNHQKPGWRNFLAFVGPGFLVSLAYLDPGNLETDLQAGSNHGYELLWVVLIGLIFALVIQSLAANLGVITGKHLSELCRAEYPKYVKYCLWLLAEIAVIAADIPEGIDRDSLCIEYTFQSTSMGWSALHRFEHPLASWPPEIRGEEVGDVDSRAGIHNGRVLLCRNELCEASGFKGDKGHVNPKLKGSTATTDAIALFGALVMPHNLFLHSALVLSRKVPNSVRGVNEACRYFLIESGMALMVAFCINVAVVSVSGTICSVNNLSRENMDQCSDLNLNSASFLLKNVLGGSSKVVYAIALFASGQSSTITGTYAGQYIMQGFLNLKMKRWLRNLMTRCIAITPSLIVSIISGSAGAGRLIIIASMILSFELPFALIPLLKFSSSSTKMGPHKNSIYVIVFSWILGFGLMGINIYYLATGFVNWLLHNDLPKVGNMFIGIIVFPLMAVYVLAVLYLTFRKDTVVTFIEAEKDEHSARTHVEKKLEAEKYDQSARTHVEKKLDNSNHTFELSHLHREDLIDIHLPN